jgi:hypothetical protein
VVLLAVIAAVVSFRHMHALTLTHGQSALTAALIPLSVDGIIVASSMTLLVADSDQATTDDRAAHDEPAHEAAHDQAGPGGHPGATTQSSAAGSTPTTDSSDKPLPGPADTEHYNPTTRST